jgi:pSer/pThr/pTyr-binding forkhead associated (FHA) protein
MVIAKRRAPAVKNPGFPQLVAVSEGVNIPLDKPIVLIGRHQECDIQIPSRKISRRHCCIALIADHLVVRDLGSTNGIRINGIKVVEGNLQPNDELMIGNMRYQVEWNSDSRHTTPAHGTHGIKAGAPPAGKRVAADESFEQPMPLPDEALSHPALQGRPKTPAPQNVSEPSKAQEAAKAKCGSLEIPDKVRLAPLNPPQK